MVKKISFWTLTVFSLLTLVTLKLEADIDGVSEFGFPFTFYDYFEGKCNDCYESFGFKPLNLLADVGLATLLTMILFIIIKEFKRTTNKEGSN